MSKQQRNAIDQIEWMRNLLAFLLVGSFIFFGGALLWQEIPAKNEQLVSYMLGQLSGMALMALGFYFVNKVGQDAIDAKRAENTSKAFDAIRAASETTTKAPDDVVEAAQDVAKAAGDKADEIGEKKE